MINWQLFSPNNFVSISVIVIIWITLHHYFIRNNIIEG